ncbi:MAG: hypothetical protein PHY45_02290 [Rhodocyclaceae bacterium]|nr:hypothetical protein [Rhodocyclaceae bacterium]
MPARYADVLASVTQDEAEIRALLCCCSPACAHDDTERLEAPPAPSREMAMS